MSTASKFSPQKLALLALLTATCVVGRLSFVFIPNVQPMTAILLLLAFYCSLEDALLVGLLSLLITNLYLGMGPWTLSQMVAFGGVILVFHLLGKMSFFKKFLFLQGLLAFFMGLLYGFLVSQMEVFIYHLPSFWGYYLQGVSFDLLHSLGNFGFYFLLYPVFVRYFLPRLKNQALLSKKSKPLT